MAKAGVARVPALDSARRQACRRLPESSRQAIEKLGRADRGRTDQGTESDRPAGAVQLGNTMLPLMPNLIGQQIETAPRRFMSKTFELPVSDFASEPQRSIPAQRNAGDMLEHRPILMPADDRAWIVTDDKRLFETFRRQARMIGNARPHGKEPGREGRAPFCITAIEIVSPSKRAGKPFAQPSLKAKGLEL